MFIGIKKICWLSWDYVATFAGRSYIAGQYLEDAVRLSGQLASQRKPTTLCYWNTEEESTLQVTNAYLKALEAIHFNNLDCHLSIKAPALRFDSLAINRILERSKTYGIPTIFDSLSSEAADETFALLEKALAEHPGLGCTLPGRWRRSLDDASWAVRRGVPVRVVKGQWPDAMETDVPLREGFLAVIDRLAGGSCHVAVATHDAPLAQEALERLTRTKTPCELELLYGLPLEPVQRVALAAKVPVRLYLPYGHGWLPYTLSQAKDNPRIFWWALRDLIGARSHL
jgi:proline dehydrogenase